MTHARLAPRRLTARIAAGLAAAATVFGIAAFAFAGGGSTSDQADQPWACNRDGSVCYDY
ncbi:hypothetical protein [Streptomyces sp. MB09-02B]|uniref:hypothetical protein n=1 Tax=Streptomyces sp. MB09-02B TaxID=3028667 RepID=UPI0029B62552|nr:hypothetical protein [Streptomyces sp. MB09-02B]MDX3638343.1 hypothetical protein [Streptomyces sp. MB09-02B]